MNEEIREIERVRQEFTEKIKSNDFSGLEKIVCSDVMAESSVTGRGEGIKAVEKLFAYPGPQPFYTKANAENCIVRYEKDRAQQSFHLILMYAVHDRKGHFHFMQYGGTFVLSCRKTEGQWKISRILFDLCWQDGNTYWTKDWKMPDFHEPWNYRPVIQKEDSVIRSVPCCAYERTDEEQIKECLYSFGWVTDSEDYELLREIAVPDLKIIDGYHNQYVESADEWTEFLKGINYKEPRLHHTYRVREITIEGNRAEAEMSRLEPNRIGSKAIGEHNYFMDWFTMDCNIELIKDREKWKIGTVEFIKHINSEPVISGC